MSLALALSRSLYLSPSLALSLTVSGANNITIILTGATGFVTAVTSLIVALKAHTKANNNSAAIENISNSMKGDEKP